MELKDLVGEHLLDAVDFSNEQIPRGSYFEACQVMRFRLDGVVYTVIENPGDGYRSSMEEILVSEGVEMRNVFEPLRVVGSHSSRPKKPRYLYDDILELVDAETGLTVVEVGTEDVASYYPVFVAAFHPEAMCYNVGR